MGDYRHLAVNTLFTCPQALTDREPMVVCDAVRCLAAACGQLHKRSLLGAAAAVAPLLAAPSPAVRCAAVAMVAAAAR